MRFLIITDYLEYIGGGFEPLGTLQIASVVREAGHEIKLIPNHYDECASVISAWKPDFVGYTLFTGYQKPLINLNRKLKQKFDYHAVFGGPHATFFPEIIEQEGVDMVCRGEGEWAVLELMERVGKGKDYTDVQNFWIKINGEVFKNDVRPLEADLDKIPPPAHDLFYQFPEARNAPLRPILTARGCPYSCTYCYNYKMNELYKGCGVKPLRHRSVDKVIEEISYLKENFPFTHVYMTSDCFTWDKKWLFEFCEKYPREIGLQFTATTRAETATKDRCKALKEAGCSCLMMGVETGNEDIRLKLLERKMSNEKILQAADTIHAAGLYLYTFNMVGLPGESLEQAYETMNLNIRAKADYTWVSIFHPYPRTKLGEYAEANGYFDGNYDKIPDSWYRESSLLNPQKKELQRLRPLMPLAVEFPRLAWLVKLLVKLPLHGLYTTLYKLHKAYCYRYRVMPIKLSIKEITRLSWALLFDRRT